MLQTWLQLKMRLLNNNQYKNKILMFDTTVVYKANFYAPERILINQGGTSSGKTYAIIQLLFTYALQQPMQVITVVGQDIPNLKKGAYRDAKRIWTNSLKLQAWFSKPNETDRLFMCRNGSIIEFTSYSNEQDAKSGKRDYLFVNEANGITYDVYWQLANRTRKKVFIDYNPSSRFWVHEHLIGKPDSKLIISDHRHNVFLSPEEHGRIEAIDDADYFKVYARGKTGKLQGLIYTNWVLCNEMPQTSKKRYLGIDFGFTNDPTVIVDVRLAEGELWVDELAYEKGMLNKDIVALLNELGVNRTIDIIADSAEPKSIAELNAVGFKVEGAMKGADSIKVGIDILKRYRINVTRRSANIRKELLAYRWKIDRLTGEPLNEPIDLFNHALDALRYIALNKLGERQRLRGARAKVLQYK